MSRQASHISPESIVWRLKRYPADKLILMRNRTVQLFRAMWFLFTRFREHRQLRGSIFLVYTMGKVASMSVLQTLFRRLPTSSSFAMHYLSDENLHRQEQILSRSIYRRLHTQHALRIKKALQRHPTATKYIITIVRDPAAQLISDIFQHRSQYQIQQLKQISLGMHQLDFDYPANWFSQELIPFSGIDVLNEAFDTEKAYQIYRKGTIALLVLRLENIAQVFTAAMQELTGIGGWALMHENRADNKDYAEEYRNFKSTVILDAEVVDYLYNTRYVKHFYSVFEIDAFKNAWKERYIK